MRKQNNNLQAQLFKCELVGWSIKDDIASMEVPLFSLTKQKDTKIREYVRGNKTVRIIPSSMGSATIFDKDILLYIASQIIEALNQGKPVSRVVHINSIDFLQATSRGDGRASFERIIDMLRRLRGTTVETNIPTGGKQQTKGFSIIDDYEIISERVRIESNEATGNTRKASKTEQFQEIPRPLSFTITVSEWFYNSLLNYEVLTINKNYFKLTKSIERRLYELARKHCGDKSMWKINIDLLSQKIGIERPRFKIRDDLRKVIRDDSIPDYHLALDINSSPNDVIFYTRDNGSLTKTLLQGNLFNWFQTLKRHNS